MIYRQYTALQKCYPDGTPVEPPVYIKGELVSNLELYIHTKPKFHYLYHTLFPAQNAPYISILIKISGFEHIR